MNASITKIDIATARSLFKTAATIRAPCSVKARGGLVAPPRPIFDITFCDIKALSSFLSTFSKNLSGNLFGFLLTA
jgi:hypothetical protein